MSDPDRLSSGAAGNSSGWAENWSHLDVSTITDLVEASLCPLLTTQPGLVPVSTLKHWEMDTERKQNNRLMTAL